VTATDTLPGRFGAPKRGNAAELRRGWTTGACATAAAKAAFIGWITGEFPDPVEIGLPRGARASFALACHERLPDGASAGVVKDAGDDPDVTNGLLIVATVRAGPAGRGIAFRAGPGVGTVTRAGLPIPPGEPAINPMPRKMMRDAVVEAASELDAATDVAIEIAIPGGEAVARKTLNPRLGVVGGLSILGTTGIVVPYSCAAWIHSIYRGIDVARAAGLVHVAGSTGATSEAAVRALHHLPDHALIDMGDFAGGMLKYLRRHPLPRVTVAGGIAKIAKLGQGLLDLHSRAGAIDFDWLARRLAEVGGDAGTVDAARAANSALEISQIAEAVGLPLAPAVAEHAWRTARGVLAGAPTELEIAIFDRQGRLTGRTPFRPVT
jgi:cobalt-precorrin-5B (C1)-methyltransferase